MNKVYRLVWNELAGVWVAVAEHVKVQGQCISGIILASVAMVTSALGQTAPAANTLPTGGQVVAGQAAITQSGATMTINQGTQRTAIDWSTFNVGSQAQVNFVQPNSGAVALNRVLDGNPSQIFGRITANGQVFLSNPGGVYFAPGASVDVGGLVATTHRISLDDFMAGRIKFDRNGATGSILNEGELKAAIGGYIALLAPEVRNQGVIIANLGTVALAAGETYELQFDGNNTLASLRVTPSTIKALVDNRSAVLAPGGLIIFSAQAVDRVQAGVINNSGRIEATGMQQRGGRIVLEASDQVELSGRIDASATDDASQGGEIRVQAAQITTTDAVLDTSGGQGGNIVLNAGAPAPDSPSAPQAAPVPGKVALNGSTQLNSRGRRGKGGTITLLGDDLALNDTTALDASGATGGGTVLVGGDWQGSGSLHQATSVTMAQGASIDASASSQGDGGKVVLWSDVANANSTTRAYGTIRARGGVNGGNGGQVETSGHNVNIGGIRVNAGADKGTGGLWLVDPADSTIDQTVATSYQNTLNTGTSVLNDVTGNIIWNSGVTLHKTAGGAATLTLRTRNSGGTDYISINSATIDSTAPSGPLNLVLWTRFDGAWGNDSRIAINSSTINTNGGNLWMGGGTTGSLWNGITVGSGAAQAAAQDQAGVLVSGSSISTGAGNIFMSGHYCPVKSRIDSIGC
jgi:fibronectin-binding autotransporter adhesin